MADSGSQAHRAIRSFVIRSGRMTDSQRQFYDNNITKWALKPGAQTSSSLSVFSNDNPLVVEIGFGMGDSLASMAEQSPDTNFIGIEVHQAGVGKLLRLIEEKKLSNIRIYCDDAVEVFKTDFSTSSIDRINIYFPDPWHKKRHHKRRLIQPEFISLLSTRLASQGILHIATDWRAYAEHTLEIIAAQTLFENVASDSLYVNAADYGRPETKFERRGKKLGHGVWDMVFINNK
jgi:tRNA (guanine-N7-)-methyltransferase